MAVGRSQKLAAPRPLTPDRPDPALGPPEPRGQQKSCSVASWGPECLRPAPVTPLVTDVVTNTGASLQNAGPLR